MLIAVFYILCKINEIDRLIFLKVRPYVMGGGGAKVRPQVLLRGQTSGFENRQGGKSPALKNDRGANVRPAFKRGQTSGGQMSGGANVRTPFNTRLHGSFFVIVPIGWPSDRSPSI